MKSTVKDGTKKSLSQLALRILVQLGILLLLLIPTYIAISTYAIQKNAPEQSSYPSFDTMQLVGPTGTQIGTGDQDKALLAIFQPLLGSASEAQGVPSTHQAGRYTAIMHNKGVSELYTFYFSPDSPDCYYVAPDAGTFVIRSHEKTSLFLNSSYAFELYTGAKIPTLTTAATDEVIPSFAQWFYRTQNGSYTELMQATVLESILTYPVANDVGFYFSEQPDTHEVVIRQGALELYRGSAQGISLTLDNQTDFLDVEIFATYDKSDARPFYGTLTYRFRMEVVEAARFTPDELSVPFGGFFLVRCENVKNADKLEITVTPAQIAPMTPMVYEKDDFVYIAFPATRVGNSALQIKYGTITAGFELTVTRESSTHHTPTSSALKENYATLLRTHLPRLIQEKGAAVADTTLMPHGTFGVPSAERIFSFGDTLTVAGESLASTPLPFDLYRTNDPVCALSAGRVLEIGVDEHIGKYVIVDHGCGLYTWYAGLLEYHVNTGDYVARGEELGLGSTALYHEESVLIMATLGKAALSVDYLVTHQLNKFE